MSQAASEATTAVSYKTAKVELETKVEELQEENEDLQMRVLTQVRQLHSCEQAIREQCRSKTPAWCPQTKSPAPLLSIPRGVQATRQNGSSPTRFSEGTRLQELETFGFRGFEFLS